MNKLLKNTIKLIASRLGCTGLLVFAATATLTATASLDAQQPQVMGENDTGYLSIRNAEALLISVEPRIEEMRIIAGLDEQQVGKLKLAAKTASRKAFDETPQAMGFPLRSNSQGNGGDSFSDEDSESKDKKDNNVQPRRNVPRQILTVQAALDQTIWAKAVNTVLTQEQQSTLDDEQEARVKRMRQSAVEYRTWQLAELLRLSEEQMDQVAEVVDEVEGDALVTALQRWQHTGPLIRRAPHSKVGPADLDGILTESQMSVFKNLRSLGGPRQGRVQRVPRVNNGAQLPPVAPKDRLGIRLELNDGNLIVVDVTEDSMAEKMGVKLGDQVNEIKGQSVQDMNQVREALQRKEDLSVKITRDGNTILLEQKK